MDNTENLPRNQRILVIWWLSGLLRMKKPILLLLILSSLPFIIKAQVVDKEKGSIKRVVETYLFRKTTKSVSKPYFLTPRFFPLTAKTTK
jgi:hypothetical protein